jgi:hypothetical protein
MVPFEIQSSNTINITKEHQMINITNVKTTVILTLPRVKILIN